MAQPNASPNPPAPATGLSNRALVILGLVAVVVTAAVVLLILRGGRKDETVIAIVEQPAATNRVNVSEVIDARGRRDVTATIGMRYHVVIDGDSRDSAAGVAHLGGLVTFVPDTHRGDEVIIEVTRVKSSTAEATVVERIASGAAVPDVHARVAAPVGPVHTGVVESVGKKGDGIIKMGGKVVFVPGVQQGDTAVFAIVDDREKHSVGQLISRTPAASPSSTPAPSSSSKPREEIAQPGEVFEVTVVDQSREHPTDGVAKIKGLIVFVPDTKVGDHLRIRIAKRMPRSAVGEIIERLPAATATPAP